MIDPAATPSPAWSALFERLSRDASLQRLLRGGARACLLSAAADVAFATPAADDLARARWSATTRKRLLALISGLAPSAGLRLERVSVGDGPAAVARTMATRRVTGPDGAPALLLVDVGPPRSEGAREPILEEQTPSRSPARPFPPRLRVLFESDASGRLTRVGPELAALLGRAPGDIEGRAWAELHGAVAFDEHDGQTLAGLLAADRTFSGHALIWRKAGEDAGYAARASGMPAHDAERRFAGHRGFLVVDAANARPLPAMTVPANVTPTLTPTPTPSVTPTVTPPVTDNIVHLRPQDTRQTAEPHEALTAAPAAAPTAALSPAPQQLALSLNERNAFREIARALGARMAGENMAGEQMAGEQMAGANMANEAQAAPPPAATEPAPAHDSAAEEKTTHEELKPEELKPDDLEQEERELDDLALDDPALEDLSLDDATADDETPPDGSPHDVPQDDRALDQRASAAAPPSSDAARDAAPDTAPFEAPRSETGPGEPGNVVPFIASPRPDAFRELVDRLPVGVLVLREGRALFANRTLLDLTGHADLDRLNDHGVDRLFAGGEPAGGVVSLRTRDGEVEPVDARLAAVSFAGEPATLISFRRAIETVDASRVEASRLDAARSEQKARELSAILDTATDGVLTIDEGGRLLSLNRSAEALFGYDEREVIGESFTLLLAPESHLTALDYLEGLKGGGVASLLNDGREVVGRVRQGGRIPLSITMGHVAEGTERKFSAVLRDMSAWKRAENDLIEARRSAERASDQKSEVLAKISHEIRTPLNAIIGFTEVMSEERFGPIGNDRYKEYLQDIHQSGGYLISLVNDLLDLAKIEAGRQRVVLRTGLHPRLPPVVADERSLKQIILNLLSNAIKFTDPGGQVIVSTKLGDRGELSLSVRDTGIGMTEKELQQALEPFRQVASTRRGQGTGLGLPITKALVEANKGALAIASARSEGTLVEVTFPPQRVLAS